ncbi:MAG: hypothetical protein CBARDCOR_4199 [uncultured Caballeronia sp.]|nr:MAG: hypothetical protein CBARDCOR_4199 [uncultured Caballeronia sp.]
MRAVFDIGGTSLRFGIYDPAQNKLIIRGQAKTPNYRNSTLHGESLIRSIFSVMHECITRDIELHRLQYLIAALPGPIIGRDYVSQLPTILGTRLTSPVLAKKILQNIGSGVRSKFFINNSPFVGNEGDAGEIGYVKLASDFLEILCECNSKHHVGGISFGSGLVELCICNAEQNLKSYLSSELGRMHSTVRTVATESITFAYKNKDAWTVELVRTSLLQPLARALATVRASIGIRKFILIGGMAAALSHNYITDLEAVCAHYYNWGDWNNSFSLGPVNDCNGLIGAGIYSTYLE